MMSIAAIQKLKTIPFITKIKAKLLQNSFLGRKIATMLFTIANSLLRRNSDRTKAFIIWLKRAMIRDGRVSTRI